MRRGVSLPNLAGRSALPLSPAPLVRTANPGPRHLRPQTSPRNQHFRTEAPKVSLPPDRTLRPEPEKRAAPLYFPHGVPASPTCRAPLPILQDAGSAARKATKGRPSLRPPVSTLDEGRLPLSPDSPSRTYFLLAAASYDRPHPRFLREQRLFCFRCEISASGAARPRPRPEGFTAVVISGSGVVGGWPAGEGVGSRETKGVGLPVVWARIV
ncbi:hypothetical protein MDA_GLEAN10017546 [Myotis davidii]|uniref:Uncharacterized protein n=1 Tax=Myotis davidii TaxID=225400 RepID=L5M2N8_MYODS|nr:hypothetical protein MDA_GLEAN10017546 [Myotis davidii]